MREQPLHRAQLSILWSLRHAQALSFSELMRPTELTSDIFKFHIQKLQKLGLIEKLSDGEYQLTATGKETANNLDNSTRNIQKQPKLSVLLVVHEPSTENGERYLFQERFRNPYYGFWACLSGPVRWGEDVAETAQRELLKQTGLAATFVVRSFYRKRDYQQVSEQLLEDKLFVILEAINVTGTLNTDWSGGHNVWLTIDEFSHKPKVFESSIEAIGMVKHGLLYDSKTASYQPEDY